MSPEDYAKASANWDKTMEAHRQVGSSNGAGSCSSDIRDKFPSCLQYEPDWCWATAVAEAAHFWTPEKYPEDKNDCHGVECKVVGHKRDPSSTTECCAAGCSSGNVCCKNKILPVTGCKDKCGIFSNQVNNSICVKQDKTVCGAIGGSSKDVTDGIMFLTGKTYLAKTKGPLSQDQLDALLSKGHPVIIAVFWTLGGGHALTLGGCAGDGKYYLHDPENHAGSYQTLTYEQIALYVPPEKTTLTGKWMWTMYLSGDLSEDSEVIV